MLQRGFWLQQPFRFVNLQGSFVKKTCRPLFDVRTARLAGITSRRDARGYFTTTFFPLTM